MLPIFIPTLGRAHRVRLPESKPHDSQVHLVVQPQELDEYVRSVDGTNIKVVPLPGPMNVGQTRQWIMDYAKADHWQIDDDVTVRYAKPFIEDRLGDFMRATEEMIMCDQYALAGFARQYMANVAMQKGMIHVNDKVWHMFCINYKRMKDCPIGKFSLYEDTVMNIHAMLNGGTLVNYHVLLGNASYQKESAGGCSTYRTVEEIAKNMDLLAEIYPQFCKVVPSETLTQGLRVGKTIRTSWSKIK